MNITPSPSVDAHALLAGTQRAGVMKGLATGAFFRTSIQRCLVLYNKGTLLTNNLKMSNMIFI